MTRYTVSIQNLYETFGEKLTYGRITTEENGSNDFYYDFYNPDGRLACCDGETVEILRKENGVFTLLSDCALEDTPFALTEDEFNIAVVSGILCDEREAID